MSFLKRSKAKQVELSSGVSIQTTASKSEETKIVLWTYDESQLQEQEIQALEEVLPVKDGHKVIWINFDGLSETAVLEQLGQMFDLHLLVLEDVLDANQRPKLEDYDDYLYLVVKMLYYADVQRSQVVVEQVSLIIGSNLVISLQDAGGDVFDPIRRQLRNPGSRLRKAGADYLAYTLLDAIVDHYFVVLDKLAEDIEEIEEELVENPTSQTLETIYNLKRELIFLHKSVWPLREVLYRLTRGESPLFTEQSRIYLRDVYDHAVQVIDLAEIYRELITGMLDIYLSSVSNRLNTIMKVLTIIATIFIPMSFLTSVYGMNFKYMPELEWRWGYLCVWLVLITLSGLMLFYFRKKKWL
ncbi:MAG: magnesium/cobalt transporter CorA [Anaerolineae bacterium]|nr:magnesium/cobalt transporter CorA [Anaerolineae bacterium]